jgi:hypothetical protein
MYTGKPEWDAIHRQVKRLKLRAETSSLLRRGKTSNNKFEISSFTVSFRADPFHRVMEYILLNIIRR